MTRIQSCFARKISLSYLSHLDMLRLFLRALHRSGLPLAYSQGFNPRPRFNLALPLPLGATAAEEYAEIFFSEDVPPEQFMTALSRQLPEGLELISAFTAIAEAPSLASLVSAALYRAELISDPGGGLKSETLQAALDRLLEQEEILITRKTKKNKITRINVRPFIINVDLDPCEKEPPGLNLLLQAGSQGGVSPSFVLEQLEVETENGRLEAYDWHLDRKRLYFSHNGILQPLSEGMCIKDG